MKYIVILGDGMADLPVKELGNKTPLDCAKHPNMDFIAAALAVKNIRLKSPLNDSLYCFLHCPTPEV